MSNVLRRAVVIDGVVKNVILADDKFAIPGATLIASDTASTGDLYDDASGEFSSAVPEPPKVSDYTTAIENHLDAVAQSRDYKNADRLVGYAGSTNPTYAAEAAAFVAWRDAVWSFSYQQLALVEQGGRDVPTVEEFIAELPVIEW